MQFNEKNIEVTVEGTAPLLMHKFTHEVKSSKKKTNYDPIEEAEKGAYRNQDGQLYIPSEWFEGTLTNQAKEFKQGKKSYKDKIKSCIMIEPSEIILNEQSYEIDARRAVVQRAAIIRWRPVFKKWSCTFTIKNIDPDMISSTLIKEMLETAGKYVGVGDYRPKFGRFTVTNFKVI